MPTTSWDEIVAMVAEAVKKAKPGEWIVGRGWHQEKWTTRPEPNVEGFPTHASLDRVSPDNPVLLEHASGHAAIANARAMALAGVTKDTPNPPGGEILKDAQGDPIGVFRETASGLVDRARAAARAKMTPVEREAEAVEIIRLADHECLSKGLTTIHTAGETFSMIDRFKRMIDSGALGVRLYVMVGESNARMKNGLAKYRIIDYGQQHLTVRAIKAYMDGALGSRGAWLLEPYTDLPGHTGLNTTPLTELRETADLAIANNYQLCIHAIGDRANRELLNLYDAAFKAHPDLKDLRWRDEHTQHLSRADIPRYGQLGVIAAMQGIHCTSDAPYVLARLGPQRAEEGAYVWQKLMKTGAVVANGTDAPVEDVDPIPNFFATVTRRVKDGSVFYGDQKMTRMEALKSYTINGAYAAFEENVKGSLKPGKLADVTVLSKDILTVPDNEIPSAKVLYTIVGGKVLYAGEVRRTVIRRWSRAQPRAVSASGVAQVGREPALRLLNAHPLAGGVRLDLVAPDPPDVEVLRVRAREVEAADARRRPHRERFGQRHADRGRLEQVEQPPLLRVVRAGRVAEGRPDAAVALLQQVVVAQLFAGAVPPLAPDAGVQELRERLGQAVRQRLHHDRVVVVVRGGVAGGQFVGAQAGRDSEGPEVVGRAVAGRRHEVGQRQQRPALLDDLLLAQHREPRDLGPALPIRPEDDVVAVAAGRPEAVHAPRAQRPFLDERPQHAPGVVVQLARGRSVLGVIQDGREAALQAPRREEVGPVDELGQFAERDVRDRPAAREDRRGDLFARPVDLQAGWPARRRRGAADRAVRA